jgi:hypothetical protein
LKHSVVVHALALFVPRLRLNDAMRLNVLAVSGAQTALSAPDSRDYLTTNLDMQRGCSCIHT